MPTYANDLLGAFESRRAALEAQRENSARTAKSYAWWTTVGTGEFTAPRAFRFDVTFMEKPHFSYGAEVSGTQKLYAGKYPRTHAGVYEWIRAKPPSNDGTSDEEDGDDLMFYTGAWMYFVVDSLGPGVEFSKPQPSYTVVHHLMFEGRAYKDVPAYLLDI